MMFQLRFRSLVSSTLLVLAFVALVAIPSGQAQTPRAQRADRYITVNGLRLHYLDWGNADKPPLIMLHGIA